MPDRIPRVMTGFRQPTRWPGHCADTEGTPQPRPPGGGGGAAAAGDSPLFSTTPLPPTNTIHPSIYSVSI